MTITAHQLPLFNRQETVLAGLMPNLKAALNKACRDWCERKGFKREALLDQLNDRADAVGVSLSAGNGRLSLATLEKWLAPRDVSNVPGVMAVNVICLVTHDVRPLTVMLDLHGCTVMTLKDRQPRDYGAALLDERKARQRKKQLEADLG